jgi:hypothetical protein
MRISSSTFIAGSYIWTASLVACGQASSASAPVRIPARLVADRFLATPVTTSGDTLGLFLDTGGGMNMMWSTAARRLKLPVDTITLPAEDGRAAEKWGSVPYPSFVPDASIPGAKQNLFGDRLGVPPDMGGDEAIAPDGFLGRAWFADRVWILDYPEKTLSMWPAGSPRLPASAHQVPLGFLQNVLRHRPTNFPRIRVLIDGDSLDMLFDTGATMSLTPSAVAALADGAPHQRAAGFIAKSVFDRWRQRHPDWRVIEQADSIGARSLPIIEVPAVSLAGYTVGPSWWAFRPDANYAPYHDWMDKPIQGSIGGSVFHYFKITLDYPHARATFER